MLFWGTVTNTLKDLLIQLMYAKVLENFRLVGGTALSLQLGHRMSVDIDLFTDSAYGTVDFELIEQFLKSNFPYVEGEFGGNSGLGKSYLVGNRPNQAVKLDLYYTMDQFFQPALQVEEIRMTNIEEIIAMKVDVVQRVGRKKDFWDLHEVLGRFTITEMILLHQQRYEWTHNAQLIRENLTNFSEADGEFDPICLKGKEWAFIKDDIEKAVLKSF